MNSTYKDQFTEWSPAYPVVFHGFTREVDERNVVRGGIIESATLETHGVTINAINKAMKK